MKGFTLIEVLVGIFLVLVLFLAILGGYQLVLKVIAQNRNRVTATSLANAQIEKIRNLPYQDIGVDGDYPDGLVAAEEERNLNGRGYLVKTRIDFVVDEADGLENPEDACPNDYKRVEVRVSWSDPFEGEVELVTDIAPDNLAQECSEIGGILLVSVFDAVGLMVESPLIEVKDPATGEVVKMATPVEGDHLFSLPVETYRVEVSKEGYNSSRTYGIDEIALPEKPDPLAIGGKVEEGSFSIDKTSSFSVETFSTWSTDNFSDSFATDDNISASSTIMVQDGEVKIDSGSSGYLVSDPVLPSSLTGWEEFSWSDEEVADTQILYQILYFDGEFWQEVPDSDLPGNSSGFSLSPVDLSELDPLVYSQLKLRGDLSSTDPPVSPVLYDWQVSWRVTDPLPIPYVDFNLQGKKILGRDGDENFIYKYSQDHNSGPGSQVNIPGLEWDLYEFAVDPATGLDLAEIDPSPQPVNLAPDTNLSVALYLEAQNSLLVTVQDKDTAEPVFSANVRLYDPNYDQAQNTDSQGRTYFIPLDSGSYNLEVSAPGFTDYSGSVGVSGDNSLIVNLERIE